MKRILNKLLVFTFIFNLIIVVSAMAVNKENICDYNDIPCWINQLQNKNWQERARAVMRLEALTPEKQTEEMKLALINLLEKESRKILPEGGYNPEDTNPNNEEAEYFYYLCKVVGKLVDPRAIPLLVKIGHLDALEPFGEEVLNIIIAKLEDKNSGQRAAAAYVLTNFLKPKEKGYTPEGEAREKIRSSLLKATNDKESFVREQVVIALGNFQDDEVIATLEDIENNDPFFLMGKNVKTGEKGIKRYTVREKAAEALEKIKKTKGE